MWVQGDLPVIHDFLAPKGYLHRTAYPGTPTVRWLYDEQ